MSKASQVPYYLFSAIFLGLNAFVFFCLNQGVTGGLSDVYLASSIACGFLAAVSMIYLALEDDGRDATEADVTFLNICVPKWFWYMGLFAAIGVRSYFAYMSNHYATGGESVWGFAWIIASILLFLMTFPNAKLYFKKRARIAAANRASAALAQAVPVQQ